MDRHEDQRGVIEDLLIEPLDGVTRIVTRENAIRGNHRHRETTQWTYVLRGALRVLTKEDGGQVRERVYRAGMMTVEAPGVWHAWQAVGGDAEVLVFTRGPRTGPGYESDTERRPGVLL